MRKLIIKNSKILKALKNKDKLTKRVNEITEESSKIEAEFKQLVTKLEREGEKVKPLIEREKEKMTLGKFEELSRVYLGKEGKEKNKAVLEIANRLEEFKLQYEKQKNNSSDTDTDEGKSNTNTTDTPQITSKGGDQG